MSRSKVPQIPDRNNRAAIQRYVIDVRKFAQAEFAKGATEAQVYERVNREGSPLPALKSVLRTEYLLAIGVTPSQIKGLKFAAGTASMFFYGILVSKLITDSPVYRYGMPAVLAIGLFLAVESIVTNRWKATKKLQKQS